MDRRHFVRALGAAAAWPLAARAQPAIRIGYIGSTNNAESLSRIGALRRGLERLGWKDGERITLDVRLPGANPVRIQSETADLIARNPAAIVSGISVAIDQALRTSRTVPIVFAGITDPVGQGFVDSLARPGRNATGFTAYEVSLGSKWIEILKEVSPALTQAAVVYQPATAPYMAGIARSVVSAGPALGIHVYEISVRDTDELANAIIAFSRQPGGGLIVAPATFTLSNSPMIVSLAEQYRLPAIYAFRATVAAGGLISYGVDAADQFDKAAGYIDRILRGTKPADLPAQGPTKFEMALNLRTAKTLGIVVPPTLIARADEVIE